MSDEQSKAPVSPLRETPEGLRLALRVMPKARETAIGEVRDGRLSIRVTTAPEDGKANEAVIKLLARAWRIPASRFEILSGHTSRDKQLLIQGAHLADVPLAGPAL
jgi:uncharacterized protein